MTRAAEWAVLVRHDGEFGYVCVAGFRCAERIPVEASGTRARAPKPSATRPEPTPNQTAFV